MEEQRSIPAKRQKLILELLEQRGVVQIDEMVRLFGVSEATVRRDLDHLMEMGIVRRTHGGAILSESMVERTQSEKTAMMRDQKARIAAEAARRVKNGSSVCFDSGTTTLMTAMLLTSCKDLIVISNNTDIIHTVEFDPSCTVLSTGGAKRQHYGSLDGPLAESFIRDFKVDIAFLGTDAIDAERGLYNFALDEVGTKRAIANCGRQVIVLSDSSKFSLQGLIKVCSFDAVDVLITDSGISDQTRATLNMLNLELVIV